MSFQLDRVRTGKALLTGPQSCDFEKTDSCIDSITFDSRAKSL